ncbi:recombinase family protein [Sulfurimonas sp.]|uniref:recombinase family protein n=1 Tax=Sulfurimonas sp. TaxID=2022749 RepID=UPI002AB04974|nr:recombinase family protein [Sulfurimonas sp.]
MQKIKYYGYCRVSTQSQEVSKQTHFLLEYAHTNKFQFEEIYEVVSSTRKTKKERDIDKLLEKLNHGDYLYISKLDRLGRNTKEVLGIIETLKEKSVTLNILRDKIIIDPNKSDPLTTMYLTLLSAFAQMERDFISERTKAGLEKARAEGRLLGKKKGSISKNTQFEPHKAKIYELLELGLSYQKIVNNIGVGSKSALYSFVKLRKSA